MVRREASDSGADGTRSSEIGEERGEGDRVAEGVLCVKVMTDEQVEVLRRQIAVYATICEQLVEMHRAFAADQDSLAGLKLGSGYCESMVASGGHKMIPRQRWCPTTKQLQMLENIFDQGNGAPSKQKIKEITLELSLHGQISEMNVYNWFQNRRARSKRKQTAPSNTESEVDTDCESPNFKIFKSDELPHEDLLIGTDNYPIHNAQLSNAPHPLGPESNQTLGTHRSNESSKSGGMSYQNFLSSQRVDQLMDNMDIPGSFSPFQPGKSYGMIG
ncbi:hypothetical protein BHE74_00030333 [Ensete ventricosum]|nr:hypothetical protein BHE74_00030333 [Ensete ventricosum]